MGWLELGLSLLKLANYIFAQVQAKQQFDAGYDKAVASAALQTLKMTVAGRAIIDQIEAMSDKDVDDLLKGLEPKK